MQAIELTTRLWRYIYTDVFMFGLRNAPPKLVQVFLITLYMKQERARSVNNFNFTQLTLVQESVVAIIHSHVFAVLYCREVN